MPKSGGRHPGSQAASSKALRQEQAQHGPCTARRPGQHGTTSIRRRGWVREVERWGRGRCYLGPFGLGKNAWLPWWPRQWSVCLQWGRPGFDPCVGKMPWRRKWQPTPELLPGKSHRRGILVAYSPWGHKESDTTEWLHFLLRETESNSKVVGTRVIWFRF